MTITRRTALAGLGAAGAGVAMPWVARAQGRPVEITIGHVLNERSFYHIAATKLGELVTARTNGRAQFRVSPSAQLGTELRLIQSARTGVIDGCFVGIVSMEGTVPEYKVLSLPHLFDNNVQANRVLRSPLGNRVLARVEQHGLVAGGFGAIFERNIGTRSRPIARVEDLRGLKLRVLQTAAFVQSYEAVGVQPTPMALGELFIAMQNGVVDGADFSADIVVADRFIEVIRHYTFARFHQTPTMLIFSAARFNAWPAEVREAIRASMGEAIAEGLKFHDDFTADSIAQMRARNLTVVDPDIGPWREASRRSYDAILNDSGSGGRALFQEIEAARRAA
jgi:TRAP-type C4-dicarboxylate transport system substrate-binding protein